MSLFTRAVASFLALSLGGGMAMAEVAGNEVRINQIGGNLDLLDIDQLDAGVGGGENTIAGVGTGPSPLPLGGVAGSANFVGSYDEIRINQDGANNTLNAFVAVRTNNVGAKFDASYDGDGNTHTANIYANDGLANQTNQFNDMSYKLVVEGDGNMIEDRLIGLVLTYTGTVTGDNNDVSMARGNAQGELNFTYTITGDTNIVDVSGGGFNQDRTLNLTITGNGNNFTQTTAGTATTFTGTYTGDNIMSTIDQDNSSATLTVSKAPGADLLTVNLTQDPFATATVTLNAEGGGSWTAVQSANSTLSQTAMTLAAGGVATINH